ncbi:hypothetical protein ADU37_CDS07420 [Thermococcus sp. 2319x1]|nr:hypothetical protein ADU37_CDS07420 [Thermococcus sp. 2319x1]
MEGKVEVTILKTLHKEVGPVTLLYLDLNSNGLELVRYDLTGLEPVVTAGTCDEFELERLAVVLPDAVAVGILDTSLVEELYCPGNITVLPAVLADEAVNTNLVAPLV